MRILLVEDEPDLLSVLRHGLIAEGYTVDTAEDGTTGYAQAVTGMYALIVLDLMLPGLNGFQICTRLRAAGVETPILVLTAKDGLHDQLDALDEGADDYLTKPFNYQLLLARIRALLRRPSATARSAATVGDLVIDTARRRCARGGVPIDLTPREFALLEMLVRANGQPVDKHQILFALWPRETADVNLVEARVSSLRRKIDLPFGQRTIETVRGFGYRVLDQRPPERR